MRNAKDIQIFLPRGYHFECQSCSKCCHFWNFTVDPDTFSRLQKTQMWDKIKKKYPREEMIWYDPERDTAFLKKIDGHCVMLEKNLCSIHRDMGAQAKPYGCRAFPFILTITPDGVYAGLSHVCPSVQDNVGQPLENYLPQLREMLNQRHLDDKVQDDILITCNLRTNWEGYKQIEKHLDKSIEESGIINGLIKVLTDIAILSVLEKKSGTSFLEAEDLKKILEHIVHSNIADDKDFDLFMTQMVSSMISVLETVDPKDTGRNTEIILTGGTLECESFDQNINIKPIEYYMKSCSIFTENEMFSRYIKHLIWRKFLLSRITVTAGLTSLFLLPRMLTWYTYVAAACKEKEAPQQEDFKTALGLLDTHIHHGQYLDHFVKVVTDSFLGQVEYFMEQGLL